jgi:hypothetical protein
MKEAKSLQPGKCQQIRGDHEIKIVQQGSMTTD